MERKFLLTSGARHMEMLIDDISEADDAFDQEAWDDCRQALSCAQAHMDAIRSRVDMVDWAPDGV